MCSRVGSGGGVVMCMVGRCRTSEVVVSRGGANAGSNCGVMVEL